jgi:hypothetical protein
MSGESLLEKITELIEEHNVPNEVFSNKAYELEKKHFIVSKSLAETYRQKRIEQMQAQIYRTMACLQAEIKYLKTLKK